MKTPLQRSAFVLPILIFLGVLQMAGVQLETPNVAKKAVPLSAEEIVGNLERRNLERSRALAAYKGTRTYRLEYHGFPGPRAAEIVVDVNYDAPDKKEFTIRSENGSQLLIERIFRRMLQSEKEAARADNQKAVALNRDNYTFSLVGQETTSSGLAYVLSVEPRTQNKLLYRGRIWVDATDFAVVRIEGEPAKNPSFWIKETRIEQEYTKVGDFWLPRSNRSTTAVRLGGHAQFTIDYVDYRITAVNPAGKPGDNIAGYK